jgi:hypothetical protein
MFTRMLVPNPKNAFQSPGVHRAGRFISDVIDVMKPSYRSVARLDLFLARALSRMKNLDEEKPDIPVPETRRFMTLREQDIRLHCSSLRS